MTATAPPPTDSAPNTHWKPELHDVPLDAIDFADNVRTDVGDVDELAASIRSVGVLEPIRVVDAGAGRYQLLFGQRRLAAARAVDLGTIPAIVLASAAPVDRTVAQLIENLHRADLNALDTARAYRAILDEGITQRELGNLIGVAQPTIANTLRLLKAPEAIQERVAAGELTRSHVEAIARLPKGEQEEVARRAVEHGLSTRGLEGEIEQAARRQVGQQSRAELRKNRDAELLAAWIELLTKKKADPATTTIVGHAGTPGDGVAALAVQGWTKARTASRGVDVTWTERAKGTCDCDAFELSYTLNYMSGRETYEANVKPVCTSKKHQAAERAAWETQRREEAEAAAKAAAEREAELAPLVAAVTMAIEPAKAKLLLYAMVDVGHNGFWQAGEFAERLGVILSYDRWREQLWKAITDLDHGQLLAEIAHRVAVVVQGVDEKHPMRTVVAGLVESKPVAVADPKPKRRAKATS